MVELQERVKCLIGNKLKVIAIITMIIDHIGAFIVYRLYCNRGLSDITLTD